MYRMHCIILLVVGMLPVHASQSQVNVWILKQHSREEVFLSGMYQEWCVNDLQKHTYTHMHLSAQSSIVGQYPDPTEGERLRSLP